MAFTPFSAKNAKVRVNSTVVTSKKWTVEIDGGDNDITNFEGGGFSDTIGGILSATITVSFDYDSSLNMFASGGLNLVPGQKGTNLILYLNDTTNATACWTFPSFLVCPHTTDADVKANMAGTYKFKNKGSFTAPTGTF